MSGNNDYIKKIRTLNSKKLLKFWIDYKNNQLSSEEFAFWASGKLLEYTVLRGFEIEGATVVWPFRVFCNGEEVEQIDGAILFDNYYIIIECKDYNKKVNIEPFAKMRNQLLRRPSSVVGCIFVSSGFTNPAIIVSRFCAPQTILLWERNEIELCIKYKKLIPAFKVKMQQAATDFVFNYNICPIINKL